MQCTLHSAQVKSVICTKRCRFAAGAGADGEGSRRGEAITREEGRRGGEGRENASYGCGVWRRLSQRSEAIHTYETIGRDLSAYTDVNKLSAQACFILQ